MSVTVPRKKAPKIARPKSPKIHIPCQMVRPFYLLQYLTVAQCPYGLAEQVGTMNKYECATVVSGEADVKTCR